ncbi:MAG: hypothetical protein H6736_08830 [Alphaproteobacteria bacterium]|nr:hypothetical protein [Alphaproteobacteria bacterium]
MIAALLAPALAGSPELCRAVRDGEVGVVRERVVAGEDPDTFCSWADLGEARTGGSGRSGRDAIAVIATMGALAPFIGGRGGSNGRSTLEMAIQGRDPAMFAAMTSAGDVDGIQGCMFHALEDGELAVARLCGESLSRPTIRRLPDSLATPARLGVMRDLGVVFEPWANRPVLEWGEGWARRIDLVQALVDMGLPRDDLTLAATDTLAFGPLVGLDALRDRLGVPLVVGPIGSPWVESARFRRDVARLRPDLTGARAKWDTLDRELIEHPEAIAGLQGLGVSERFFDGSLTPVLHEGGYAVATALLAAGAKPTADFLLTELLDRPDLRGFLVDHGITLEGTWTRHPWAKPDIDRLLADPALLGFTRAVGLSLCPAVERAAATDHLDALRGQRLTGCEPRALEALAADRELLEAALDGPLEPGVASTLAAVALEAAAPDVLELVLAHAEGPLGGYRVETAVLAALDAGRPAGVRALGTLADVERIAKVHPDLVVEHVPPERLAGLGKRLRADLAVRALRHARWSKAIALADAAEAEAVGVAAEADAPSEVFLALIRAGHDPSWPVPVLPIAVSRRDAPFVMALLEAGAVASPTTLEAALDAGLPPDVVAAMVGPYTPKSALKRLRKRAAAAGWSEAEVARLSRPR